MGAESFGVLPTGPRPRPALAASRSVTSRPRSWAATLAPSASTHQIMIWCVLALGASVAAQLRGRDVTDLDAANAGRGRGPVGKTPKDSAPIDLTGYWVSIVSEDWRFRMLTPPKGD